MTFIPSSSVLLGADGFEKNNLIAIIFTYVVDTIHGAFIFRFPMSGVVRHTHH